MADDSSFPGFLAPANAGSDIGRHDFHHDQLMGRVRTKTLGKIVAVHPNPNGALLPPTVDWQPLAKQMDGQGGTESHGTVYGSPIKRHQGGDAVFINDPVVGDVCEFSHHDRDISGVVNAQGEAPPGSNRRFSMSDAVCNGTVGSKTAPVHYIQVARDGNGKTTAINFTSSATLNLNGIIIDKDGNATFPGTITAKGNITAGFGGGDSVTLQAHIHPGTQKPVAGT